MEGSNPNPRVSWYRSWENARFVKSETPQGLGLCLGTMFALSCHALFDTAPRFGECQVSP